MGTLWKAVLDSHLQEIVLDQRCSNTNKQLLTSDITSRLYIIIMLLNEDNILNMNASLPYGP